MRYYIAFSKKNKVFFRRKMTQAQFLNFVVIPDVAWCFLIESASYSHTLILHCGGKKAIRTVSQLSIKYEDLTRTPLWYKIISTPSESSASAMGEANRALMSVKLQKCIAQLRGFCDAQKKESGTH